MLWGVAALLNSASSSGRKVSLLQVLLGGAVLLSAVISHFTPGAALGELFFIVTTLTLAALVTLLIMTAAPSDIKEITSAAGAYPQNPEVKSASDLWRLVKSSIQVAEEADFRVQIILFFFFVVLILLIQLT